jgi:haloalkane dehalogenase
LSEPGGHAPPALNAGRLQSRRVDDVFRTPEDRFDGLWGEVAYADVDGLRIARHEEGDGPPVVFFHGEPTWSYLWRKVIPAVRDAGYRCIAPDLAGFGRSDKPTLIGWYSYDRHVAVMGGLLEPLGLRRATAVVHDWGGPIGLRLAVEHPEWFDRVVVLDTGLFTGRQAMSDAWRAFRDFVERTEDLPIAALIRAATARGLSDADASAYDAPFPTLESKAGARAFPLMLPTTPEAPGAAAGQRVVEALRADDRPALCLWADADPVLPLETGRRFAAASGMPEPEVIADASHFLQEDAGEQIGRRIATWLTS